MTEFAKKTTQMCFVLYQITTQVQLFTRRQILDLSISKAFTNNRCDLYIMFCSFNPLPNDKFLDWSKLKAVADDKSNVAAKLKFVLGRVENIVGKGENAGYQHFLLVPQCFQKASLLGVVKSGKESRLKSIVGKGEHLVTSISLCTPCFQKHFHFGVITRLWKIW